MKPCEVEEDPAFWPYFSTTFWAYAILAVPILLLPTALGRRDDLALCRSTTSGY